MQAVCAIETLLKRLNLLRPTLACKCMFLWKCVHTTRREIIAWYHMLLTDCEETRAIRPIGADHVDCAVKRDRPTDLQASAITAVGMEFFAFEHKIPLWFYKGLYIFSSFQVFSNSILDLLPFLCLWWCAFSYEFWVSFLTRLCRSGIKYNVVTKSAGFDLA